jgi:hypothetical protein
MLLWVWRCYFECGCCTQCQGIAHTFVGANQFSSPHRRINLAAPTAELEPLKDGAVEQTDEQDMGMTYEVHIAVLHALLVLLVLHARRMVVAQALWQFCGMHAACLLLGTFIICLARALAAFSS